MQALFDTFRGQPEQGVRSPGHEAREGGWNQMTPGGHPTTPPGYGAGSGAHEEQTWHQPTRPGSVDSHATEPLMTGVSGVDAGAAPAPVASGLFGGVLSSLGGGGGSWFSPNANAAGANGGSFFAARGSPGGSLFSSHSGADVGSTLVPGAAPGLGDEALQCQTCLRALLEVLAPFQAGPPPGASPDQQKSLVEQAFKRARSLDREAQYLLNEISRLPSNHPAHSAGLREDYARCQQGMKLLEGHARNFMKELPKGGIREAEGDMVGKLSGQAPTLHAKLDELDVALNEWGTASKGHSLSRGDARITAQVDKASAAFEDFRVGGRQGAKAKPKGADLLKVLKGYSHWSNPEKVQELLKNRQTFLCHRLECGKEFLKMALLKKQWPNAEPWATAWQKAMEKTLGPYGAEEWRERARELHLQRATSTAAPSTVTDTGVLRIRKIRAGNLRHADVFDDSDPYVKFEFAGQEHKTSVVMNNEKDPRWNEEFRFEVDSLRRSPILKVSVWDWDFFTEDDSLGNVDEGGGGVNLFDLFHGKHPTLRPGSPGVHDASLPANTPPNAREMARNVNTPALTKSNSGICTVAVQKDGSVTSQTGCIKLKGEGAGNDGAWINFEVTIDSHGDDPLVLQPTSQDEALKLVAEVERSLKTYLDEFRKESLGFFLQTEDQAFDFNLDRPSFYENLHGQENQTLDPNAMDPNAMQTNLSGFGTHMTGSLMHGTAAGSKASDVKVAQRIKGEVWQYNQELDVLNLLVSDKDPMTAQASYCASTKGAEKDADGFAGILARVFERENHPFDQLPEAKQHEVTQRFGNAVDRIRSIEHAVSSDPSKRRVYAFQDDFLPQIGIWSTDRRRKLRNEVFLATLKVHGWHHEVRRSRWKWIAIAVVFALLLVGLLLYGALGGKNGENSWLIAGIGMAVLTVLTCCGLAVAYQWGSWQLPDSVSTNFSGIHTTKVWPGDEHHAVEKSDGKGAYAKVLVAH